MVIVSGSPGDARGQSAKARFVTVERHVAAQCDYES